MGISGNIASALTVVRTTCEQCYYQCGMLAHVKDGRVIKVQGDPEHPQYDGRLCPKGGAHLHEMNTSDRVLYPLKRVDGGWQRVSWDAALAEITDRLVQIKGKYGPLAIAAGSDGGPRQVCNTLMVRALGSPNVFLNTMTCSSALQVGDISTYGEWITWDFPPDYANSRCILVVGSNPPRHCPPSWHKMNLAMKQGAKLITVDPRSTECTEKSDLWLRPNPGTDAALALCMAHIILTENLYDYEFVEKWCYGFDEFRKRVADYPVDRVAGITGIAAEDIVQAARMFATTKPACIHIRNGISGHLRATQTVRALTSLLALTGNLDIPGGNRFLNYKLDRGIYNQFAIHRAAEFRLPREIEAKMIGTDVFPLYSGPDSICQAAHGSLLFKAMLSGNPYPVRAMIAMGSNPVSTHPNAAEVRAALKSLDLFVVAERAMTPTAQLADFVLPVTDFLERDEVCDMCYRDHVSVRQKVVEPAGESWDDREINFALAERLAAKGALDYPHLIPWRNVKEFNDFRIEKFGLTFEELKQRGVIHLSPVYKRYEHQGFATPTGKVELYSTLLERWGFDPLPAYEPVDHILTHAGVSEEYPLILITGARHWAYKNSEMRTNPWLKKVLPHPLVEMHPDTAAALGVQEGDWIDIKTPFGGPIRQRVIYVPNMHPNCIAAQDGWWFPERPEGGWADSNINVVTPTAVEYHDPISGMQMLKRLPCAVTKADSGEHPEASVEKRGLERIVP